MEEKQTTWSWLEEATRGIRFRPDREAAARELREHIEDKTADLLRIFPGMTEEEAMERAMDGMGDPQAISRELGRVHTPWLGYLWRFSQIALACLSLAILVYGALTYDDHASHGGNPIRGNTSSGWYVEPLALAPEQAELGGYTFRITEALCLDAQEDWRSGEDRIAVRLRVTGPRFWERIAWDITNGLTVVTADGSRWPMDRAVVGGSLEEGQYISAGASQCRWGVFYREFIIYVETPWKEGDRVGLEFDFEQGGFGLSAEVVRQVVK